MGVCQNRDTVEPINIIAESPRQYYLANDKIDIIKTFAIVNMNKVFMSIKDIKSKIDNYIDIYFCGYYIYTCRVPCIIA